MSPRSSSQGFVRSIRRSVSWYALKEYVDGASGYCQLRLLWSHLPWATGCLRSRSALTRG